MNLINKKERTNNQTNKKPTQQKSPNPFPALILISWKGAFLGGDQLSPDIAIGPLCSWLAPEQCESWESWSCNLWLLSNGIDHTKQ